MQIQPFILILATVVLLGVGAAGGYTVASTTMAPGVPAGPAVPTLEEANAAWNYTRTHNNPFGLNEDEKPDDAVTLGDCGPSTLIAGVVCMATIKTPGRDVALNRNVAFARSGEGIWIATPM